MNVSKFDFLEKKLTEGSKIYFNLGNKFQKFYTSMINDAINVFPRVSMCLWGGGGGGGGVGGLDRTI